MPSPRTRSYRRAREADSATNVHLGSRGCAKGCHSVEYEEDGTPLVDATGHLVDQSNFEIVTAKDAPFARGKPLHHLHEGSLRKISTVQLLTGLAFSVLH